MYLPIHQLLNSIQSIEKTSHSPAALWWLLRFMAQAVMGAIKCTISSVYAKMSVKYVLISDRNGKFALKSALACTFETVENSLL